MEIEVTTELMQAAESVVVVLPDELYLILGLIVALLILIMFSLFYNR